MQLSDYTYWVDANLPPKTTSWLTVAFNVKATNVLQLDFLTAADDEIFHKALRQKRILLEHLPEAVDKLTDSHNYFVEIG